MCTLAVALGGDRRWPVVVAANRDERLARATEGWAVRDGAGGPRYAAPRDLQAGGTWMGVSSAGVFAAVTNRHMSGGGFPDVRRRSRGELVPRALAQASAADARTSLGGADPTVYNPFHLVVADARAAFLWWYDGEDAALEELGDGLHVVTESRHDGRDPRGELVRARWPLEPDPARFRELLSAHGRGRDATCIHQEPTYGTRSSAVLRLAASVAASNLFVCDTRPCAAAFEDRSDLLAALAACP